jgi:glycosyltransferase involved in cell wall biosynthesis
MKMKILQVIQFFTPNKGGSVAVPYALSKELTKRGHEVTIITSDFEFDKEYARSIEKHGVNVIPFKCIINIASFLYSPKIKEWLKENLDYFDIIHMHNYRTYQNNIVYYYAKKYDTPYIIQAHGSLMEFYRKHTLKKFYDFFWGKNILNDSSICISVNKKESKQYLKMGIQKDKIRVLYNGINFLEYKNLPQRGLFKRKINLLKHEKIILFLGRIDKIKGLDLLIDAFAILKNTLDNTKLIIVGPDSGFLPAIKKKIKKLNLEEHVLLLGPLYDSDKISIMVDSDVFVLPSIYETFPLTLIEACACEKPVIVSVNCDISHIVENRFGIVFEHNIDSLNKALTLILSNEKLSLKFGKNGREFAKRHFDWKRIVDDLEMIYTSLIRC